MKNEIRILGIDDGAFRLHSKEMVDVVGVVFRGGYWLEGLMRTRVQVDSMDVTEKIANMIINSPHYPQLKIIMLSGVTFAGLGIVDMHRLYELVKLPFLAVTRKKPDFDKIKKALKNLTHSEQRWKNIKMAGEILEVQTRERGKPIYVQMVGISEIDTAQVLRSTSTRSNIPEPLRVAHIIASGLSR